MTQHIPSQRRNIASSTERRFARSISPPSTHQEWSALMRSTKSLAIAGAVLAMSFGAIGAADAQHGRGGGGGGWGGGHGGGAAFHGGGGSFGGGMGVRSGGNFGGGAIRGGAFNGGIRS